MVNVPDQIRSNILNLHVDIHRYEAGLRRDVVDMLTELGQGLIQSLMGAGLDTPRTDWQRARLRALLEETKGQIDDAYGLISTTHESELLGLIQVTGKGITKSINDALGADVMMPPKFSREMLRKLAGDTLIEGAPSASWWSRQAVDLEQGFSDTIRQGVLRGETVVQMRNRVLGQDLPGVRAVGKVDLRKVPASARGPIWTARRNAEALVRTSVISVANAAHQAAYGANADIMAGEAWCATLDPRTCVSCGALDGKEWKSGEDHPIPSLHWGCFVPGTMVQAPNILHGFERPYSGDVIIMRTSGGNEVTCTPNHPILTDHGWVPAGEIKEGNKVVKCVAGDWPIGSAPNGVEVKSRIEDVVTSLLGSRGMVPMTVPLTSEDFHGDALNHQIAVVWSYGKLGGGVQPAAEDHGGKFGLIDGTPGGDADLTCKCGERLLQDRLSSARRGFMRLIREAQSAIWAGLRHTEEHGFTLVALGDPRFSQPSHDDRSREAKMLGQRLDAHASMVAGQQVLNVERDTFRGLDPVRLQNAPDDFSLDAHPLADGLSGEPLGSVCQDGSLINGDASLGSKDGYPMVFQDGADPCSGSAVGCANLGDGFPAPVTVANGLRINPGGLGAHLDAAHSQDLSDEVVASSNLASDLIGGKAVEVSLDDVISVEHRFFEGHVYNLETEGNWYVANGIITHNCRCAIIPVTKSWEQLAKEAHGNSTLAKELDKMPEGNRASMGKPVSGNLTYEDWFGSQPQSRQVDILGPGKFDLWQKGHIGLTGMIDQSYNPLTLNQLRSRFE